jgi:hypothetical protein
LLTLFGVPSAWLTVKIVISFLESLPQTDK